MQYFYSPIAYYNGDVLKCKGIATEENKGWFVEQNPGTVILKGYRGDRILAINHAELAAHAF